MLISFTVGNYRSIKDPVTLSMVCSRIKELPQNTIETKRKGLRLLKTAVIYGANASGKSNVLKAMEFMKNFIYSSSMDRQKDDEIPVDSFLFNTETVGKLSYFEIVFLIDETIYRYGFEADRKRIHSEWLFSNPKGKERTLFSRDENGIKVGNNFKEGKRLESRTRDNALFLSVCVQFNGKVSSNIFVWVLRNDIFMGMDDIARLPLALKQFENKLFYKDLMKLLGLADLQIEDINIEPNAKVTEIIRTTTTSHFQYDKDNNNIGKLDLKLLNESDGTRKYIALSPSLLFASRENACIALIIDELDARLHPLISASIIRLYNENTKSNSQLIFSTHDTNLLDNELFRRDQIWFTEKDKYGATDLYSLVEFKGKVRNDASYEKDYIVGRYGAVPYIGDFSSLFDETK